MINFKQELDKIVQSKNLVDTTWSYFWGNYDSYLTEYPNEAAEYFLTGRNSICPTLDSICYKHFMESDNEYIIVRVNIDNQNAQYLGYYDACFSESGEIEDDFFVIE